MERLTEKDAYWYGEEYWVSAKEPDELEIDDVYMKLKEYEDAEEKGLLLQLPCKVGDTVYFLTRRYDRQKRVFVPVVHNGYVKAIKFSARPTKITVEYEDLDSIGHCKGADYYVSNIGKSLFFTKAEAEKHWQK